MIVGGLPLLMSALDLLAGKTEEPSQTENVNGALVPLGMPLLAGPGAIVIAVLAVERTDDLWEHAAVWSAIAVMCLALWLTMRYALLIVRVVREGAWFW